MPSAIYGTTSQSAYCPVREVTFKSVADNEIWLAWALLQEEVRLAGLLSPEADQEETTLARRTTIYRVMIKTMADSKKWHLDETIIGVIAGAIMEWRLSNLYESQKHLKATFALLSLRGGLRAIQDMKYPAAVVCVFGFVNIRCMSHFDTLQSLRTATGALINRLSRFQSWNQKIRSHRATCGRHDDLIQKLQELPNCQKKRTLKLGYLETRAYCFNGTSAICPNIRPKFLKERPAEARPYAATLYLINSMLYNLREDEAKAIEFLEDLVYTVAMSIPEAEPSVQANSNRPAKLSATTVMLIVLHCATNLGLWKSSEDTALRSWEAIEFVDLMMLTSPDTQAKITESMCSWLMGSMRDRNSLVLLDATDLARVLGEIENS